MSDASHDPLRWKDQTDQSDLAERSAGHAVRCVRAVPLRSAPSLSRIAAHVHASRPSKRLAWVVATAALILGLATAASAAHLNLLPSWLTRMVNPRVSAPARDPARPVRAKARPAAPVSPAEAPSPAPAALPVEQQTVSPETKPPAELAPPAPAVVRPSEVRAPSPARKVTLVEGSERLRRPTPPQPNSAVPSVPASVPDFSNHAPSAMVTNAPAEFAPSPWPSPPVVAAPSPVPSVANVSPVPAPEPTIPATTSPKAQGRPGAGKYLTEAIHALRAERAPALALRLLDSHDGELAKGGFGHEALILRVEALLALGRRAEVLRLLDGTSLTDVTASRSLLVTRGELRAAANRCAQGIGDFDLVLARSRQTDRQALIGRALCHKQLGDAAGMRADIERLRREFPGQALPGELAR